MTVLERIPARHPRTYDKRLQEGIQALSPQLYLPMQEKGAEDAVNYGSHSTTVLLGSGRYVWSHPRFLPNRSRGLDVVTAEITLGTRLAMTGDQTRLAWIRTSDTDSTTGYDGNPALCLMGDTTGTVWDGFGVHAGKVRWARFNNTAWQYIESAKSVNDMSAHMIAVTYNSSTRAAKIYVDGQEDGSGTITAHQNQGGINKLFLGFNSTDQFVGQVAHLGVWTSVLTAAQIADLWRLSQLR